MAGYDQRFVRILIGQARAATAGVTPPPVDGALGLVTPNLDGTGPSTIDLAAQQWLQALITALFAKVGTQGESHLISTSMNGKSIQFQVPSGMTRTDVMMAAQTALEWLASGYQGPTTEVYARAF
jgi:hypothetical protein